MLALSNTYDPLARKAKAQGLPRFTNPNEEIELYLAGQSNCVGQAEAHNITDADVLKYASMGLRFNGAGGYDPIEIGVNTGGRISDSPGRVGGMPYYATYFYKTFLRRLKMIKFAIGGHALTENNPQTFHPNGSPTEYNNLLAHFQAAAAISVGSPKRILIWTQGENDATTQSYADDYGTNTNNPGNQGNLEYFINTLETDLGWNFDVIVITAHSESFTQVPASGIAAVRSAQEALVLTDTNRFFLVDPTSYPVNADLIHGGADWQKLHAEQAYLAALFLNYPAPGAQLVTLPAAYQDSLRVQSITPGEALLRWDVPATGADSYQVKDGGVVVASPSGNTATITGLDPGTSHNFTVEAVRSGQANEEIGSLTVNTPANFQVADWVALRSKISEITLGINRRGGYGYADLLADESNGSISGVTDGTQNHIGSAYEGALDLANGVNTGGQDDAVKEACYRVLDSYLDYWIANGTSSGSFKREFLDNEHQWVAETVSHLASLIVADKGQTEGTVDVDAMIIKIDGWLDDALISSDPGPAETEEKHFANAAFRLYNLMARAAITENQVHIDQVYQLFTDTFMQGYGLGSQGDAAYEHLGFGTQDMLPFQHNFAGHQPAPFGYGDDWYNKAICECAYAFAGTPFALSATQAEQVQDYFLSLRWLLHKNRAAIPVLERNATIQNDPDQFGAQVNTNLADFLSKFAGVGNGTKDTDLATFRDAATSTTAGHITGVQLFPQHALLVVKTAEAMLVAKGTSTRDMTLSSGDGYATRSFNFSPGLWLYGRDSSYDAPAVWDHRNPPGTVSEQLAENTLPTGTGTARTNYKSLNTYLGAAQQGNIAILAYKHHREAWNTIQANIVHVGLPTMMVTVLNEIHQTGTVANDVLYTIDQCVWASGDTLTYNIGAGDVAETAVFTQRSLAISGTVWFHLDNMGYVIIAQGSQTVDLYGENRSGDWNDLDSSNSAATDNERIFQLSVNLGNDPNGASVVVIAFPASTPAAVASFAASPGITIARNDATAISVESGDDKAIAFFAAGSASGITTDKAAVIAETGNTYSVADPEQNQSMICITNAANYQLAMPRGIYAGLPNQFVAS